MFDKNMKQYGLMPVSSGSIENVIQIINDDPFFCILPFSKCKMVHHIPYVHSLYILQASQGSSITYLYITQRALTGNAPLADNLP